MLWDTIRLDLLFNAVCASCTRTGHNTGQFMIYSLTHIHKCALVSVCCLYTQHIVHAHTHYANCVHFRQFSCIYWLLHSMVHARAYTYIQIIFPRTKKYRKHFRTEQCSTMREKKKSEITIQITTKIVCVFAFFFCFFSVLLIFFILHLLCDFFLRICKCSESFLFSYVSDSKNCILS